MIIRGVLFILALVTWILINWSLDIQCLAVGVMVGILVSYLASEVFLPLKWQSILKGIKRCPWLLYYIVVFIWECIKANIDGAYRVIHPDLPIKPGIVKVKTTLRTDTALTFLANSLTLKPGTMTVDLDKANGFLYVHWADVKSQDIEKATEFIVGKLERILKRVFE